MNLGSEKGKTFFLCNVRELRFHFTKLFFSKKNFKHN
jgi:hypothetical protein